METLIRIRKKRASGIEMLAVSPCFDASQNTDTSMRDSGIRLHKAFETGVGDDLTAEEFEIYEGVGPQLELFEEQAIKILGEGFVHHKEFEVPLVKWDMTRGFIDDLKLSADGTMAIVTDYKMGFIVVTAPEVNPQAISYVLALFDLFPKLQKILFCFFQPRVYGDDVLQQHVFIREKLSDYNKELCALIEMIDSEIKRASHRTCPLCKHFIECDVAKSAMLKAASHFAGQVLEAPKSWDTPEEIYAWAKLYKALDKLHEAIKKKVIDLVCNGNIDVKGISRRSGKKTTLYNWDLIKEILMEKFEFSEIDISDVAKQLDLDKIKSRVGDDYEKLLELLREKDAILESRGESFVQVK